MRRIGKKRVGGENGGMKLFYAVNHQYKGNAYIRALEAAGYVQGRGLMLVGTRFCLADNDWNSRMVDELCKRNIPLFLYPHAARPLVQYDGPIEPKRVRCMFTMAAGGVEIMKRIGYPYPVEAMGWSLSEVRPFCSVERIGRVLFAPIHPNANGYLNAIDKDLNRRTYDAVSRWCRENGAVLKVRYCGELGNNGLAEREALQETHVEWLRAKPNGSTLHIEWADVVVAHQTFAYMAVALGVPTLMMGEDVPPRTGNSEAGFAYVKHWEDYRELLRFPLDVLDESRSVDAWMRLACESDALICEWKRLFIGEPFDAGAFVATIEEFL